ncbi:sensor histidine kinase [Cohnella herbarum]|uniref:histidine kinase n=1 Tax=Cohnella herbarum TaxID=2728023 RepID=A0A7Z2VNJ9_9BACL|nr:sensor histidine kinase [Cohnella herbarum]QJD86397.1 sensor histidine kinase [Cohnella herbarum]
MLRRLAKAVAAAALLFALNGLINYSLMKPQDGASESINQLRVHLDDGVFTLLFVLIAIVFWAMFAVLPRERGYLYLGVISLLTSLLLFTEWDQKELLFGPFPEIPYNALAIKSGIVFMGFSFLAYLLGTSKKPATRVLLWCSCILWITILTLTLVSADPSLFVLLSRIFFVVILLNIAISLAQSLSLLRQKESQAELQRIAGGFFMFMIVLLPDPVKDLWEAIEGRSIGYRRVYWEQCLEDTLPWALLSLVTMFGVMFFQRFVRTLKDKESVSEELRARNVELGHEVTTRQRLDQLLSAMLRAYRIADLEQSVLREGKLYFLPHSFLLVKYEEAIEGVQSISADGLSSHDEDYIRSTLLAIGKRLSSGETIVTGSMVLGAAGGTEERRLFLAVYSTDGGSISLEERDKFALSLMSKYVSIFYEYFQLMENRLKEMQQIQGEQSPWLSKLFMQIAEKERKRLASDLHDEVLQELLHTRRILERTSDDRLCNEDKEQIRLGLENAEYMIRETCRELMPPFLSDHGVLHAVAKLVEKTRLRADFQLDFHAGPVAASFSDELNTTIYRIVQELVNNALKHSQADRVNLDVGQEGDVLYIRYADNGKGMETAMDFSSTNRFGLKGIAERIRMIDGEITVQSSPGQGVKVWCSVPIPN